MQKPWKDVDESGNWTLRWREKIPVVVDGQTIWKTKKQRFACGMDRELYEQKYEEILGMLRSKKTGKADTSRTIQAAYDAFIAECKLQNYPWRSVRVFVESIPWFLKMPGVYKISDATPQKIKDYKSLLLAQGANTVKTVDRPLSANTCHNRLSSLRSLFSWCVSNGWLDRNPFTEIAELERRARTGRRRSFIPKPRALPRFYTDQEIITIENVFADYPYYFKKESSHRDREIQNIKEFHAMTRLGYMAGMREGEITTLRGEQIRFNPETKKFEAMITSIKGGEEKRRVVPLRAEIMDVLPKKRSGYLFDAWLTHHPVHGMITDARKISQYWDNVRVAAKITREPGQAPATFYGLRHTFARIFLEGGRSMKALADLLGHEGTAMLDKIYGHLQASHHRNVIDSMAFPGQNRGKFDVLDPRDSQLGAD